MIAPNKPIVRERGILFSAPMVRAILAGRKTQTRRVVNAAAFVPATGAGNRDTAWASVARWKMAGTHARGLLKDYNVSCGEVRCPYGAPGDRLWVRETFRCGQEWDNEKPRDLDPLCGANQVRYEADGKAHDLSPSGIGEPWACRVEDGWGRLRPGIFLPRWASRLTLAVESVRVERLQEISDDDISAEGVIAERGPRGEFVSAFRGPTGGMIYETARHLWQSGWDSINGKRAPWSSNPWVWVVTFSRVTP